MGFFVDFSTLSAQKTDPNQRSDLFSERKGWESVSWHRKLYDDVSQLLILNGCNGGRWKEWDPSSSHIINGTAIWVIQRMRGYHSMSRITPLNTVQGTRWQTLARAHAAYGYKWVNVKGIGEEVRAAFLQERRMFTQRSVIALSILSG